MKRCTKCKAEKPLAEFCNSSRQRDGLYYYCRACQSVLRKAWRAGLTPEQKTWHAARGAAWRAALSPEKKAQIAARRAADKAAQLAELSPEQKEHYLVRQAASKFGVSVFKIEKLRSECACNVCGDRFVKARHRHIDHCHRSGLIRGVLCHWCNTGIGNFKDDPARLQKAAEYLRRARLFA